MTTIDFIRPIPGLEARSFHLLTDPSTPGVYTLQGLDAPSVRLLVIDPTVYLSDYVPVFTTRDLEDLGVGEDSQATILVVAAARGRQVTVNLMAPVVINAETGKALQVILEGQDLDMRHALTAA